MPEMYLGSYISFAKKFNPVISLTSHVSTVAVKFLNIVFTIQGLSLQSVVNPQILIAVS